MFTEYTLMNEEGCEMNVHLSPEGMATKAYIWRVDEDCYNELLEYIDEDINDFIDKDDSGTSIFVDIKLEMLDKFLKHTGWWYVTAYSEEEFGKLFNYGAGRNIEVIDETYWEIDN